MDQNNQTMNEQPVQVTSEMPRKSSRMLFVILGIGLLLLVGVFYMLFSDKQDEKRTADYMKSVTPTLSTLSPEEQDAANIELGDDTADFKDVENNLKDLE